MKNIKRLLKRIYSFLKCRSKSSNEDLISRLRTLPRFQSTSVDLLGGNFIIPDGPSFYYSYREIFDDLIYDFGDCNQPVIIDCGANCGLSVLFTKQRYPDSNIIAFEADPNIFQFLSLNVKSYGLTGVSLHNKAIWSEGSSLSFRPQGADSGRVLSCPNMDSITVESISLNSVIDGPVDFLKVDIEGAETDALLACTKLSNVSKLFVEYHSFINQPQRLDELLACLRAQGFRYSIHQQIAASRPFMKNIDFDGMDLQLNIFAWQH